MTICTSSSICSPRPDLFNPRLESVSSAAVLVGYSAPAARGASLLLLASRPDPTISTSGSLRSSPLAPAVVEPLLSLSACSRRTNASSSRCMSSSMRALNSYECGFVTLCAPPARAAQAWRRSVPRHILFQNVPTPLLWRCDNCFRCRHHHCRYWWWLYFRLFPNELPRNLGIFK